MRSLLPLAVLALTAGGCGGSGGGPPGGVIGGGGAVSLQEVQASIFTPRCALSGCHVAGSLFGLDLSAGQAYGNIVNVPSAELAGFDRVVPFDAANSYLFMKVTSDPRIQGDPMPARPPLLSTAQLQLLADWIEQGAPQS